MSGKDFVKDAIFLYEEAALSDELKMAGSIAAKFDALPEAATTLIQTAHTLDEAATLIDQFKAKTCSSNYNLAVLNINKLATNDLRFLLKPEVLGNPQAIFLASLRNMAGQTYACARDKVQCETVERERTPSCIDCYSAGNREAAAERIAALMAAYLKEGEERAKAKREGLPFTGCNHIEELLKKSPSTLYGWAGRSGFNTRIVSE
jgi:hypothetical protein